MVVVPVGLFRTSIFAIARSLSIPRGVSPNLGRPSAMFSRAPTPVLMPSMADSPPSTQHGARAFLLSPGLGFSSPIAPFSPPTAGSLLALCGRFLEESCFPGVHPDPVSEGHWHFFLYPRRRSAFESNMIPRPFTVQPARQLIVTSSLHRLVRTDFLPFLFFRRSGFQTANAPLHVPLHDSFFDILNFLRLVKFIPPFPFGVSLSSRKKLAVCD